jgi:hypothetical protein
MKTERSMGTLMTVFSGMAALLCLLVGLQLLVLEKQIEQADARSYPGYVLQLRQWKDQAHTGAVMSLGAGVLILLFALRHNATTIKAGKSSSRWGDSPPATIDPDTLSIRVFESDAADHYVEISSEAGAPDRPGPGNSIPRPIRPAPVADSSLETDLEPEADPADSIVEFINQTVAPENSGAHPSGPNPPRPSFIGRLFGSRRRG